MVPEAEGKGMKGSIGMRVGGADSDSRGQAGDDSWGAVVADEV